jgi:hypothetical protein
LSLCFARGRPTNPARIPVGESADWYNARAIACYRECGFVVEGRERDSTLIEGLWEDDLIMSLLD